MDWDQIGKAAIALFALTAMEIVLGIDNIVFISILTGKLPKDQQKKGRRLGLGLALATRLMLLGLLFVFNKLTDPIITLSDIGVLPGWLKADLLTEAYAEINGISVRDLILLAGGLFLIGKSVVEIHERIEGAAGGHKAPEKVSFTGVIVQIAVLDIVFSLDSVITAVGMADDIRVMMAAVIIAVSVMLVFSEKVSRFVEYNPTIKMLALSFLILIGVMLVSEGAGSHVQKGYVYFAMVFALIVEVLNLRVKAKSQYLASVGPGGIGEHASQSPAERNRP
jgi:predicted tellurium resistance membrane protein TerC